MLSAVAAVYPPEPAVGVAVSVADPADPWLVAEHAVAAVCRPEPAAAGAAVLVSEALPVVPVSVVSLAGPGVR